MALRSPPLAPADTSPGWEPLDAELAEMEAAAVRRAHPEMTDDQVSFELVRRRYDDDLAARMAGQGALGAMIDVTGS
jgi:hypothetical protein